MKGKHVHDVYGGRGYGKGVLCSVMMRGARNEKHRAPGNSLAWVKVKPQMLHDWVTPKVPIRICI